MSVATMCKGRGWHRVSKKVIELLKLYRCYKYAAENAGNYGSKSGGQRIQYYVNRDDSVTLDEWDYLRYSRIVQMINGAVMDVLSDNQRKVIQRRYLDRNPKTMTEIADELHVVQPTVSRWHKEAIKRLTIALAPLQYEEINDFSDQLDKMETA